MFKIVNNSMLKSKQLHLACIAKAYSAIPVCTPILKII